MTTPVVSIGQRYQDLRPRLTKPRIVVVVRTNTTDTVVRNEVGGRQTRMYTSRLYEARGWRLLPPVEPASDEQTLGIYKFSRYFGRSGDLSGVFTATRAQIKSMVGTYVYFGEVLGKHSEVSCVIAAEDVTLASENPEFVEMFNDLDLATGTNPLNYIEESEGGDGNG